MDISMKEQRKNSSYRHSPQQIASLEEFFKRCPYPNENQRRQLSKEVGLETRIVKFWFQNKRAQARVQKGRVQTIYLRGENERIRRENLEMREKLKDIKCPSCNGTVSDVQELQRLEFENASLRKERDRLFRLLSPQLISLGIQSAEITTQISEREVHREENASGTGESSNQADGPSSSSTGQVPKLIKFL